MSWIKRRHRRDQALASGADELWNQLRSAIQDTCDDYNELYAASDRMKAACELENGRRIRVSKLLMHRGAPMGGKEERFSVVITLMQYKIAVSPHGPVGKRHVQIDSDGESVYLRDERGKIEIDVFCELVLEPLLFPRENFSDPA